MESYLQTGIGILVSLVLFIIGYRQTIGARKERSINANGSVKRAIMRRMVLENYSPTTADIARLLEGKAREFNVSVGSLLSQEQMLNSLFTEVFDSDLISPTQRTEIETKISECFKRINDASSKPSFEVFRHYQSERKSGKESLTLMVLTASTFGALSTVLFGFWEEGSLDYDWFLSAISVLVASVALLSTLSVFKNSKEVDNGLSAADSHFLNSSFESEIFKLLIKNKISFQVEPSINDLRPDFLVQIGGKSIAIEAKAWDRPIPIKILGRTLQYMESLLQSENVDKAIVVTRKNSKTPVGMIENSNIKIVPINRLITELQTAA